VAAVVERGVGRDAAGPGRGGRLVMPLILLWLLGVPLSLILILFLLGVGR
jgi:hypothetical protein